MALSDVMAQDEPSNERDGLKMLLESLTLQSLQGQSIIACGVRMGSRSAKLQKTFCFSL